MSSFSASLLQLARQRAGLSQAELARRAGTSQSSIALYEAARRSPTMDTLVRLLAAAGFELRVQLEPIDDHDDILARWLSTIPPSEADRFAREQSERLSKR